MSRDQMQRLLMHRAAVNRVDRSRLLKAALQALDQRTFARSDWSHQIQHLTALLAFERGRVKITDQLRNGFFDAEELVGKEIVNLDRFVFVQSPGARVVTFLNIPNPRRDYQIIFARMS